jgi:hypothetical protein
LPEKYKNINSEYQAVIIEIEKWNKERSELVNMIRNWLPEPGLSKMILEYI